MTIGLLSLACAQNTVLFYGQSNMNGMMALGTGSPPAAQPGTLYFDDINLVWGPVPAADGLRNVLNALTLASGTPWRGINGSVNATGIEYLMDTTPVTGGLGVFQTKLTQAGVLTANLICWMQGEGNTNESPPMQARDYITDLDTMHGNLATMMGKTRTGLPLVVAGLTTYGAIDVNDTDWSWWTIRRALFDAGSQISATTFSHSNMDGVRQVSDPYHLDATSQARNGARFAQTVKSVLGFGGTSAHWEATGGTTVDATHTNISLGLIGTATDFTPVSGITGFDVTGNNGATWTAVTGARVNATTIQLTHASLSTTNARKVRYQYGMLPDVSAPVLDNSALALPLTFTRDEITPTALSTIPRPDYWGSAYDNNQSGITQTNAGIPIGPAVARRLVIVGLAGATVTYSSVTITPNIGTVKTATLVQGPAGNAAALAYALLDADGDTATTVTVSVTYSSSPFSRTQMEVWAIPSGQLSSTTPTATQAPALTAAATSATLNIATSAAGVVIAMSRTTGSTTGVAISGTESYANRHTPIAFIPSIAADSCNDASNASSTVTATYNASGDITLVAAAWR